jgi:hypothetical protein
MICPQRERTGTIRETLRAFRVRTASQAERRRVDTLSTGQRNSNSHDEDGVSTTREHRGRKVRRTAARRRGPCSEAAALGNRDDIQPGKDDYA